MAWPKERREEEGGGERKIVRLWARAYFSIPILPPGPVRMLMTPGGNPALTVSSANFKAVKGVTYNMEIKYMVSILLF